MSALTAAQIYLVARQAGFPRDAAVNFTAIALAESGGRPDARLHTGVEDSRGLWQINIKPGVHKNVWGDLYDPQTNARAAFDISNGGRNLYPWSTTHHVRGRPASYEKFLDDARRAAADAESGAAASTRHGGDDDDTHGAGHGSGASHVRPIEDGHLTDTWGAARSGGRRHEGIDIFAKEGTPIHAVAGGKIVRGFHNDLGGNVVRIQGDDGNFYYYAHLKDGSTDGLRLGQRVKAGDVIGQVGNTGDARTTPPHLHFQVQVDGKWVNPYTFLKPLPEWNEAAGAGSGADSVVPGAGKGNAGADAGDAAAGDPTDSGHSDPYAPPKPKVFVDTDKDGLSDDFERILGTDPKIADTDRDGLSDFAEVTATHTDPTAADTDHDGERDAVAVSLGHDPGHIPLSPQAQLALAEGTNGLVTGQEDQDPLTAGFEAKVGAAGAGAGAAGAVPGAGVAAGAGAAAAGPGAVQSQLVPMAGTAGAGGDPNAVLVRAPDGELLKVSVSHYDPLRDGPGGAHDPNDPTDPSNPSSALHDHFSDPAHDPGVH
jgi:murein DD-endopeptidase MepM/ murein hydrolase activator NlpD